MKTPKTRLQAELDRRAVRLQAIDASGGDICQDDYEWATMTGQYAGQRASYQGYEDEEEQD